MYTYPHNFYFIDIILKVKISLKISFFFSPMVFVTKFTFLRCHWFHILIIPSRRCDPSIQWRRIKIEVTKKSCHYDSSKKVTTTSIQALFNDWSNLCLPNKAELVQIKSYFHFRLHVAYCSLSFALLCFCFYTLHILFLCN
jgi:hypothetical protein